MIINMDDIEYKKRCRFEICKHIDYDDNITDIIKYTSLSYMFQKYILKSRCLELDCFLRDMDVYYFWHCYTFFDWPEMEERIRKCPDCKIWYEEHTGTRI